MRVPRSDLHARLVCGGVTLNLIVLLVFIINTTTTAARLSSSCCLITGVFFCTMALKLISLSLQHVASKPKKRRFCGIEANWPEIGAGIVCCKVGNVQTNKVHIGVCDGSRSGLKLFETSGGHQTIGYNEFPSEIVTPEQANSDTSANEENPGKDEGVCHVYRVKVQKVKEGKPAGSIPSCIPGNMVMAARDVHEWLESNWEGLGCSMTLGANCQGALNDDKPYDFAIKMNENSSKRPDLNALQHSLQITGLAIKDYNCNIKEEDGDYYVVCPL